MKKIVLAALILLLFSSSAQALYNIPSKVVTTGHGITQGEPNNALMFLTIDQDGKTMRHIDAYTGSNSIFLKAHENRIHQAVLGSDDYIYYVTNLGTTYYLVKVHYSDAFRWYNGEEILYEQTQPLNVNLFANNEIGGDIKVIDSGIMSTSPLREDNNRIYYIDTGYHVKYITMGQDVPTTTFTLSNPTGTRRTPSGFDVNGNIIAYTSRYTTTATQGGIRLYVRNMFDNKETYIYTRSDSYYSEGAPAHHFADVQFLNDNNLAFCMSHLKTSTQTANVAAAFAAIYNTTTIDMNSATNTALPYVTLFTNPTTGYNSFRVSSLTDIGLRNLGINLVSFTTSGFIGVSPVGTPIITVSTIQATGNFSSAWINDTHVDYETDIDYSYAISDAIFNSESPYYEFAYRADSNGNPLRIYEQTGVLGGIQFTDSGYHTIYLLYRPLGSTNTWNILASDGFYTTSNYNDAPDIPDSPDNPNIDIPDLPDIPDFDFPEMNNGTEIIDENSTYTGSLNSTFLGSYYNTVNNSVGYFTVPVNASVSYILSPVNTITDIINDITGLFNTYAPDNTFIKTILQPFFNGLPMKLQIFVSFKLLLMIILLILNR